jgi:formylglycine-generating enzyme required for sulfatase activity
MALTGQQIDQIQQALLDSYDRAGLQQMVRARLNVELDEVAGGNNLREIVFNLVQWADWESRVQELIDAALAGRPTNTALRALQQAATSWHLAPPEGADEPEPYKGLDPFDEGDADLFFGRDRLTADLVAYLCDHRLLAVVGASGSGKSSVVRAGVVPALRTGKHLTEGDRRPAGSECWPMPIITPTAHPLKELSARLTSDSESVTAQTTLIDDMGSDARSLDLYASRYLARLGEGGSRPQRLLLIVDQFEELFTLCRDREERRAFVDNLLAAAAPDSVTTVILTLRADFYAHCAQFDNLRQALESCQRYIGAMSEEELRQAIEAPAAQGGWDLEPGLVDLMLEDVAEEPGALPLLSHALLETWKRRSGRRLTLAGYQASGRVQGAIAETADSTLKALTPQQQAIARSIFLRLTELGEGVQATRRRVLREELAPGPEVDTVLQTLQNARLVTTVREETRVESEGESAPSTYVDVAHEALIREWPALREWLAEDREGLRIHRRLTDAAQEWARLSKDPGALYRGLRLEQTQDWAKDHASDLNELERAFLAASHKRARLERYGSVVLAVAILVLVIGMIGMRALGQQRVIAEQQVAATQQAESAAKIAASATAEANAKATAVANLKLAKQQLQLLEGERLLKEARAAREEGEFETALARFQEAADADPTLDIDVAKEKSETRRYAALQLIYKGEELAAQDDDSGAEKKFKEALAWNPPADTPVYVWIPEGAFLMGSDPAVDKMADESEFHTHTVDLDGFWIMRTEVTNEQYARCVEAKKKNPEKGCDPPSNERWRRPEYAREPVTDVNWSQAISYTVWVGGRLPTEAEWEKACRGMEGGRYPWGKPDPEPARLNYYESGLNGVVPVGSYAPGASGLYDMAGNVWEWTSSKYDQVKYPYPYDPDDGREEPEGGEPRTLRGGSFGFVDSDVRCANRFRYSPLNGDDNYGFRVVWSPGS